VEAIRCLHPKGSMFVCCSYHSIGPIMWLLQTARINFVHIIPLHQFNQNPVINKRILQYSHYFVVWVTKHPTQYRFDYDAAKWGTWPGDKLNDVHGQLLRDGWNINHNGGQNTTAFPSQKPIALYDRILRICGLTGGMFGDWFSGSGTGAVAALRWGMRSISIERNAAYVPDIIKRIEREMQRKRD
jgi:site-specific DNA-methyltransferase (adenine-specific)